MNEKHDPPLIANICYELIERVGLNRHGRDRTEASPKNGPDRKGWHCAIKTEMYGVLAHVRVSGALRPWQRRF
jgi:hypothetical protein